MPETAPRPATDAAPPASPTAAPEVYHPVVDRILRRFLAPGDLPTLRAMGEAAHADPLSQLTHDAALKVRERDFRLARMIKHVLADLTAAAEEVAGGRPAEHLLSGRHDELPVLAHRHHDAISNLEKLAALWTKAHRAGTSESAP
jgi:hypothetical protein